MTTENPQVWIWSFEHDAWWAPNECGYTDMRSAAGLYDRARAEEICTKANGNQPDDSPHEEIRETGDYIADPKRIGRWPTGIYIRGRHGQSWAVGRYDLNELDRDSLKRWLQRDPGVLAERTLMLLLGHDPEEEDIAKATRIFEEMTNDELQNFTDAGHPLAEKVWLARRLALINDSLNGALDERRRQASMAQSDTARLLEETQDERDHPAPRRRDDGTKSRG